MQQLRYDDKRQSRGLRWVLFVGRGNAVHVFDGKPIDGIVAVLSEEYRKNGKWSGSVWTLRLHPKAWAYQVIQDWGSGMYFHNSASLDAVVSLFRLAGFTGAAENMIDVLRQRMPNAIAAVEAREAALRSVTE